jgi:hypothetical protein
MNPKTIWPPMNADKRRWKTDFLSAFIGVHRRLSPSFLAASGASIPSPAEQDQGA